VKHERTVRECTFQASDTAPPCVVLVDPDNLSPKRYSHNARWTWTEEESLFFASLVLSTLVADLNANPKNRTPQHMMDRLADSVSFLNNRIDPQATKRKVTARKKRLVPKRKGA
jgi:hypothetical protein